MAPKLMDSMRDALRSRHYSRRTEKAYCLWVRRYVRFHKMRHPAEMGGPEINRYLTYLAVKLHVSASTQTQALSALLFLYRHVIGRDVEDLGTIIRARKAKRLPTVLTPDEVVDVLAELGGETRLMAALMYGAGLRLTECLRLRVQDVDFSAGEIKVRATAREARTASPCCRTPAETRSPSRSSTRGRCIAETSRRVGVESSCRERSGASTRTRRPSGRGSGCFRRRLGGAIR